ncbi:helix-turn-helix domain-containing protein [Methylocystis iwaonis]|uniref:helix-turn-helix domain-containing protein n=1 Tax=Methylocystis iwaonis TaxID=2885079 RepID=UPI002E7C1F09|nr:helix-turn-helix domain-containing protein [Methylocystis iwaonis]
MEGRIPHTHTDLVRSVVQNEIAPATSAIAASWRRSMTVYGLDPGQSRAPDVLTEAELRQAREELEPLARVAQAPIDRLFGAVAELGCCVLLTNKDGVPIEGRGADEAVFQGWGLRLGAMWSEAREGTNGIGTCLAEARALTIHRDQHFRARHTGLSCTVAPIYDHQGRLAAALDVSCGREIKSEGLIGLVAVALADAARAIEALNFRQFFADARIVLSPSAGRNGASLLAVDRHDLIIGATRSARLELDISDARIAAQLPAVDLLLPKGVGGEAELVDAERGAVRRALARAEGNVSAAAKLLGVSRATLHRKMNKLGVSNTH